MIARHVAFGLAGGRVARCVAGGIIGRAWSCAVRIDDPEVSEAHAMVSWRDGRMRLLALRGLVHANGTRVAEVTLRPKLELRLSRDSVLTVGEVSNPLDALFLAGAAGGTVELQAPMCSVVGDELRVVPGLRSDAHLVLWTEDATWWARPRQGEARAVAPDDSWPVPGGMLAARAQPEAPGGVATRATRSSTVRVLVQPGVARIAVEGAPALVLGGNQAELLAQLAAASEPQHWTTIARYFWGERDRDKWRERFDAMVKEVRSKFRDHRVRSDLLWSWDGSYRLNLEDGDELLVSTEKPA